MPYIRGEKLNIYNFNELSIEDLLSFIEIFLKDTHIISQNGIYTYDRSPKFDVERINRIFSKPREQAKAEVEQMLSTRKEVSQSTK